jgi:aminopeptidase N
MADRADASAPVVRRADYRPPLLRVPRVELTVQLFDDHALVLSRLTVEPQAAAADGAVALAFDAVGMQLLDLRIDGVDPGEEGWSHSHGQLRLHHPPSGPFGLETLVQLEPHSNTALEGLYVSGGLFTTQCEAEGFRRITPFPDRPDVLSRYRVRIEADRHSAPVLLSNGNGVERGDLPAGRHYAVWEDPFPKPCYLFALVAGCLQEVRDQFTTASGRTVQLRLHVEPGDEGLCAHALASLRRCMAWDEQVYGLEYDLDEFNVVAVRHFNMGAMENKSLNIFNSKLVLADAKTATDAELERIESVMAHEYFHNWTGNRVTCRDWFQLSLKEGLTVFRDQQFTADLHGAGLKRIADVALLRAHQFPEDEGPTAHPVQPDHYIAIDNFYTTTIYEKGAELIRMQRTLLGDSAFRRGVSLYLQRHDGEAATCDQFVQALEEASGVDLGGFRRWYHQAGTPRLRLQRRWDPLQGCLELELSQHHDPSPGQPDKQPLPIPVSLALFAGDGRLLLEELRVLEGPSACWRFDQLPAGEAPIPSLLRGLSAPVRLEATSTDAELEVLMAAEPDPVNRWDAAQQLWSRWLLAPDPTLEALLARACRRLLALDDLRLLVALLQPPAMEDLEAACLARGLVPDPPALAQALLGQRRWLAEQLGADLAARVAATADQQARPWPDGVGERQLQGLLWSLLAAVGDGGARAAAAAAVTGPSMTLARAGLAALQPWPCSERQQALQAFQRRWLERPVVLDAWFALEASTPFGDAIARAEALLEHPCFDPQAPNSVRAVLGGFGRSAPAFHHPDGRGYRWLAQQLQSLDQRNPIAASRLLKLFSGWRRYGPERQAQMQASLAWLLPRLQSPNSLEVVRGCLADPATADLSG